MKNSKRILSLALSALMLMSMFTMVIGISASAATVTALWDGSVAEDFSSGTGTETDPYIIMTAGQLALMASNVNAGTGNDAFYKLGADIVLNENVLNDDYSLNGTPANVWTPIGTSSNKFKGTFDGDGHTISGVYFNGSWGQSGGSLFGYIGACSVIKNLKIADSYVYTGGASQGILALDMTGEWNNTYIEITNVDIDGVLLGSQSSNGMFSGKVSYCNFTDCVARGRINHSNATIGCEYLAGFFGENNGATRFSNCVNYADINVGTGAGFVGKANRTLSFTDCINYGNVTSDGYSANIWSWNSNEDSQYKGFAAGFVAMVASSYATDFTRCSNEGDISGKLYAGGFIGKDYKTGKITMNNVFNSGDISVSTDIDTINNGDSSLIEAFGTTDEPKVNMCIAGSIIGCGHNKYANYSFNSVYNSGNCTLAGTFDESTYDKGDAANLADDTKWELTASTTATYQSGSWLDDTTLWVVKAGQNPTLTLVAPAEEETEPEFKVSAASVTLQSNLQANYKVNKNLFETAGYSAPYMTFTLNGKTTRVDDFDVVDNYYVFRFADIAPDKMNDTITSVLYATKGETVEQIQNEYSIATYCYNQLAKEEVQANEKLRTLLVDMLNYGAASQTYTGYNTANLVNAALSAEQKGWETSATPALTDSLNTAAKTVENATATWIGAALRLTDRVEMKFILDTASIDGLTVKFTNAAGDVEYATVASGTFERRVAGGYYVYFDGFDASQMSEVVYVTAYKDGVAVSNTIAYSVETYACAKQSSTVPNLSNLVIAMMKYGNAAKAYASV